MLPALALDAANSGSPFVGFYFEFCDDEESQNGEWSYWTSETADATATNKYYTSGEIRQLLSEFGFQSQ